LTVSRAELQGKEEEGGNDAGEWQQEAGGYAIEDSGIDQLVSEA